MRAIEKRLDKLASKLCRLLHHSKCYLGNHEGHDPHHVVGRNHKRLRWDQDNLVWLCRTHHNEAERENWTFGKDLDQRVYIWSLGELEELEKEIKQRIKETR